MKNNVCWIDVVKYEDAGGGLKAIYDNVTSSDGNLDNLYQAFSLRPHIIKPADDLYKAVLHNDDNALPKWFSELISTFVAIVTGCEYARSHHGANFVHLLGNEKKAESIILSLEQDDLDHCGDEKEVCALRYVRKLCREPENISFEDISLLSNMGWRDGEILEIVQIVSTLSYFCRVINGVGISLAGDRIGLY
jgi:uncharacterized peroxidase-related enzyme